MDVTLSQIFLYFFFYSFLGWLWETIYCSIQEKKFQYRGFLVGPYCPIYGTGVLILLYFLTPLKDEIPVLFIVAFLVMSAIEYSVSYVLEKLFHTRWWDYSNEKFNIDGRVALKSSLFWATMSIVIVYFIQPPVHDMVGSVLVYAPWLPAVLAGVMLVDTIFTVARLAGLYKLVRLFEREVSRRSHEGAKVLQEYVAAVINARPNHQLRLSERRLFRAFPGAFSQHTPHLPSLRELLLKADQDNKPSEVAK